MKYRLHDVEVAGIRQAIAEWKLFTLTFYWLAIAAGVLSAWYAWLVWSVLGFAALSALCVGQLAKLVKILKEHR